MSISDKMMKKLMNNPEFQFKMIIGLIDNLNENLDKVTEDVINNANLSITDYHGKLLDLSITVEKNLHYVAREVECYE